MSIPSVVLPVEDIGVMPMEIFVVARVGLATFGKVRVALYPGQHAGLFLARVGMQTLEGVKVLPPT